MANSNFDVNMVLSFTVMMSKSKILGISLRVCVRVECARWSMLLTIALLLYHEHDVYKIARLLYKNLV